MKIIILGAEGFLGSALFNHLKVSYDVLGIDISNYKTNFGKESDIIINADGNSKRYWANENIIEDFIASTLSVYKTFFDFKAKYYIYISSVDVYNNHDDILQTNEDTIINPNDKIISDAKVLVAAGWKPGFSTDYDAVLLAKNIGAKMVINMTNVDYAYDKDPKLEGAKPIEETTWKEFRKIVGSEWKPGLNMPFDPIASKECEKLKLKVAIIGKDIDNLRKVLDGEKFKGTMII